MQMRFFNVGMSLLTMVPVLTALSTHTQAFPVETLERFNFLKNDPSPDSISGTTPTTLFNYWRDILTGFFTEIDSKPSVPDVYLYGGIQSVFNLNETIDEEFNQWLNEQADVSFHRILQNIGGVGILDSSVAPGAVIASPSKENPNYFYQWVRDAAITVNSLTEYLQDNGPECNSDISKNLFLAIESYIANNYKLQRLDNKSGTWESLDGLGEPKFMADSTTFDDHWGRPQRDGPGLRVIAITNYINFLLDNNMDFSHPELLTNMKHVYENIIKPDLTYIMLNWNENGFDLWEEVDSIHLFTALTMLKALKAGIKVSNHFDDKDFGLKLRLSFTALRMYILLESGFKNSEIPYLIETPSLILQGKRCGLDIASILATLRAHDMDDPTDFIDIPFSVDDSAVLSTLAALVGDMKFRYPINHQNGSFSKGFALGRYPEDLYDGLGISEGNPWFISTATASELLYKMIYFLYDRNEDLVISREQLPFFSTFINIDPNTTAQKIIMPYGSQAFIDTTLSLMQYADSFLEVIRQHVDADGHMSEQFNRYTGYMEGAKDLTWSYGSFWSAVRWRMRADTALSV